MPNNNFLTNDIVTFEALDVLENTYNVMRYINSEYSDRFEFGGTVLGQTISIRKPPRFIGRLGQAAQIEGINETFVPLTISYQRGIDTQVSSQQLALDIDDYRKRVLEPKIVRLSSLMAQDVCNLAQGLNNFVGTIGTTPASLDPWGAAKAILDNGGAPEGDRYAFVNPAADVALMLNLKGLFNSTREISSQYKTGSMTNSNEVMGFNFKMDQQVYTQTVGNLGTSTPITSGVPAQGATTITTTGWQSGASTLNAGDIVSFVSSSTPVNSVNTQTYQSNGVTQTFVVTATTSDSTGTMVIPIGPAIYSTGNQQNVTNMPPTSTPVYVYNTPAASFSTITGKVSPQNMAAHKDFGTLAMVDLPLPGGTDTARRAASRKSGKSIRVIRDYVATTDQWLERIDVLYGVAVLRQELGVRVGG